MAVNTLSDFLENALLNEAFGATAFTPSATLYVGLSTTSITDAGGNITEPNAPEYARVAIDNDKTTWTTSTTGGLSNDIAITFAQATSTGGWGTITDGFVADQSSGGNVYTLGALGTSKSIEQNDTPEFPAGSIVITLD